ncbi:hypothetical protein, partial [Moorena producens]|uniref:hypothetical protein n=1 Tax=Moorena producens TaxID=1155739 RepID=UPI001055CB6C
MDLSSFELISNHSTFSTEVISHYTEGNIHHLTIRPVSDLWAGLHKLSASISNEFGFKSRNRTLSVFIDPWPPEVVKRDFMDGEKLGPTRKQLSFEVTDTKRQAVLHQPTDCIIGIGAGAKEALRRSGIYTVLDLVKVKPATVRIEGFSISELMRWNELAKVVYEVFIDPKDAFPFFSMSVEQFVLEVQLSPRLPEVKLKEMKENLKKLYTAIDIDQLRTLRLTEFIQTKGSQVKSASATLDGKETSVLLDQKSVIVDLPELSHGSHQVTLHLTDHCGNTSAFSSGFFMDIQPPLVLDSFPRPNAFVKQSPLPVAIKFGDSDSGIDQESVKITMDGDDLTSQAFITRDGVSLNVKNLNEGEHEMGLEVSDQVGNTLKERISFVLDTIPPLVSYDHHLQIRHTATEKISLTGISSEPLASITIDGNQHLIERQKKFEIEVNLAPGENTIGGVAVDLAGNETMIQPVYVYRINQRQLSIQGRILDFKQEPVSNARIYVDGHNIWTQSNE